MERDLTPLEIIGVAIRKEEQAKHFYDLFASKIKNEIVKAKYLSLAEEESKHKKLLINLYKDLTGGKETPPPVPGGELLYGKDNHDLVEIDALLHEAIKREEDARRFYLDAATKMHSQSSRRMLEYLADMERDHALILKTELEAYERDSNWYSDNPDVQLVGP